LVDGVNGKTTPVILEYDGFREHFSSQDDVNAENYEFYGSGASADNSPNSVAETPRVTPVSDRKRLEIRDLGFSACGLLSGRESSETRNPWMHQNPALAPY
jgi:hypothetical protein